PLCFEAAILARMRPPATSRTNWSKRQQNMEHQATHRARRVEPLLYPSARHRLGAEECDQPATIGSRTGHPFAPVADHDAHPLGDAALRCVAACTLVARNGD